MNNSVEYSVDFTSSCLLISFTVLAHLNLSQPRQIRKEVSHEKSTASNTENETCLVARSSEVKNEVLYQLQSIMRVFIFFVIKPVS